MARPRKKPPVLKNYAKDLQDTYVHRIDECQRVLEHLINCPAWEVIQRDLNQQKQFIDDNWQNLAEGDGKLKELRITKLAYMHLLQLTDKYTMDLENARRELDKLQNTDKKVVKDYDGE
jgi:hypothetical protein